MRIIAFRLVAVDLWYHVGPLNETTRAHRLSRTCSST